MLLEEGEEGGFEGLAFDCGEIGLGIKATGEDLGGTLEKIVFLGIGSFAGGGSRERHGCVPGGEHSNDFEGLIGSSFSGDGEGVFTEEGASDDEFDPCGKRRFGRGEGGETASDLFAGGLNLDERACERDGDRAAFDEFASGEFEQAEGFLSLDSEKLSGIGEPE